MKRIIPYFLCVSLLYNFVEPDIVWNNTYTAEPNAQNSFTDIINLPNGHIGVLGYSKNGKSQVPFFMIIDGVSGKEISIKKIPTEGEPKLNSFTVTDDGFLILVGSSVVRKSKEVELGWLVKLTLDGDWVDSKTIPIEEGQFRFEKIISLSSGENLLLATCDKAMDGSRWLGKVTDELNTEQLNIIGNQSIEEVVDVKVLRGDKILIGANSKKSKSSKSDNVLIYHISNPRSPITHETPLLTNNSTRLSFISANPKGSVFMGGSTWKGGLKNGFTTSLNEPNKSKNEQIFERRLETEITSGYQLNGQTLHIEQSIDGRYINQQLLKNGAPIKDFSDAKKNFFDIQKILKTYHGTYILAGTDNHSGKIRLLNLKLKEEELLEKSIADSELKIEIKEAFLKDRNKNNVLSSGENGTLKLKLKNLGGNDIDGKIRITNASELKNLHFPTKVVYMDYLGGNGDSCFISVPIRGAEKLLKSKELVKMELQVDGYKSFPINLEVETGFEKENLMKQGFLATWQYPDIGVNPLRKFDSAGKSDSIKVTILCTSPIDKSDVTVINSGTPLVDDKAIDKANLIEIKRQSGNYRYDFFYNISQLTPGENIIQVKVKDYLSESIVYTYDPRDLPNLHLLAIGPAYGKNDLKQNRNDAIDFESLIRNNVNTNLFKNIRTTVLVDSVNTTKDEIETEFNKLANQFKHGFIKPKDHLMIFYSGHGTQIGNKFFLVPSNYKKEFAAAKSVDYANLLEAFVNEIGCNKVLFIDACLSGMASDGLASKDLSDETISKFLFEASKVANGTITFTSCSATEDSYEHEDWKNGAFTEALIEGLTGGTKDLKSDIGFVEKNSFGKEYLDKKTGKPEKVGAGDNIISVRELNKFLEKRVPRLVISKDKNRKQNPSLISKTKHYSFPIFTVIKK